MTKKLLSLFVVGMLALMLLIALTLDTQAQKVGPITGRPGRAVLTPTTIPPTPTPTSGAFPNPLRLVDTRNPTVAFYPTTIYHANQFYFIKVGGASNNGNHISLTPESADISFFVYDNTSPLYCALWYASGNANPLQNLYGVDFSNFIYNQNGRSGGGTVLLNPRGVAPNNAGFWLMSNCELSVRIEIYAWSGN